MYSAIKLGVVGALTVLLAACGGTQNAPVTPVSSTHATRHQGSGSRMLSEAKSEDLMYVVGACGGTCVLSYPKGNLVGNLDEPGQGLPGLCSDTSGNVFISNNTEVLEYAHGGTSPIATLQLPGSEAAGCSFDPTTGNLAVVFRGSGSDIAVFGNEQGQPTLYGSGLDSSYCGYDNAGNLYVNGFNNANPGFSVLQAGQSQFKQLSISSSVGNPGQVQWDGHYITYQSGSRGKTYISQLQVSGSSASVVGTVNLKGIKRWPYTSWIFSGHVVVPYSNHGTVGKQLGQWHYPEGGGVSRQYKGFNDSGFMNLQAVTISAVAP